jgi:ankyrin repeat protein
MSDPTVFISYRREDSAGYAGRLFDRFVAKLGRDHVFRDIENIAPGDNFADSIRQRLSTCDVLIVIIGPRWLTATDQQGRRRLDDEHDLARAEIELGLERKIRVIPVLLPGTTMPAVSDLPPPLAALAALNAIELRESHFDQDVALLTKIVGATRRGVLRRLVNRKYLYPSLIGSGGVLAIAAVFWLNPLLLTTPERARLKLTDMGLNFDSATFVHSANRGDSAAVKLFLRAGIDVDETPFDQTAAVAAAEEGHLEIVRLLAEAGANMNRALLASAGGKNKAVFEYLLSRNPEEKALAGALHVAAGDGDRTDLVRRLLDRGVDVNAEWGGTALMSAAYYGNLDILKLLIERGANVHAVNKEGETALHYGARGLRPSIKIVGTLLGSGAQVNAQDHNGRTALMNGLDSREVTQSLLAQGADVRLRTKDGDTALAYAAGRDMLWLIKPLIDRGADVNTSNKDGETPLMWASGAIDSVDKPQMAQMLIDNGADLNAADKNGTTALMFAAQKGLASTARTLLQAHAQPMRKNKKGQTALDIARTRGEEAIVKLLVGAH